jgi:RES domain-containing protein
MSTLTVWRLCREAYAKEAFTGEGARLYGGRWSPSGTAVTYCSESRSLAAMEVLVNMEDMGDFAAQRWLAWPVSVPVALIEKPERVPDSWRQYPYTVETQNFGASWVREKRSVVLRLPSAVVLGEFNYLLNPHHADFARITTGKPELFQFDPRLA